MCHHLKADGGKRRCKAFLSDHIYPVMKYFYADESGRHPHPYSHSFLFLHHLNEYLLEE